MTDIVSELRDEYFATGNSYFATGNSLLKDAADEIERQDKEIIQLRSALADAKTLACTSWPNCPVAEAEAEKDKEIEALSCALETAVRKWQDMGDAKAEERERCAEIALAMGYGGRIETAVNIAAAIRKETND